MSLLLDALKKAAQEKQHADAVEITTESDATLSPQQSTDSTRSEKQSKHEEPLMLEEFELDDDVLSQTYVPRSDAGQHDEPQYHQDDSSAYLQNHRITPTPSTVTDEALQLLRPA